MNTGVFVDASLWIDKTEDCVLSGGLTSPFFVPKVSNVTLEYDSVLSNTLGM
jgi:hypothetical protein